MKLCSLTPADVSRRLCGEGLLLRTGPFNFRIVSSIESVAAGLRLLYADSLLAGEKDFVDFTVTLQCSGGLRRWWRQQVILSYDGTNPFVPLPLDHAFPLLEWAMNWCISTQAHHVLTLHAAVLERGGRALIMPAPPGSGKSTLCAGLTSRNWRLLSDELTLFSLSDGSVVPLGRPISLKNESLKVIREFAPDVVLNDVTHDTSKGSVSHMKVPTDHVQRLGEPARPRWVVFPRYVPGAPPALRPRSKADSMLELGRNAFNYTLLGLTGFEVLADVVDGCDCYDFSYSRLEDAVAVFDRLVAETAP
ncbi:MAG: HprK-related kinase A [Burkholderiaceae bacterium]|nr:HprK-related kinase A [Burkholderiaceae bacterium]